MKKILTLLTLLCFTTTSPAVFASGPMTAGQSKGKFMNFFDANEDGTVTLDEFNESAKARFERIDSDKDGMATKDEFRAYIKSRRNDRKQRQFAKMDTDNDGQVTKDEYIAHALKKAEYKFTRMDKDGDGVISTDEHAACKHGKHKRHGGKIFQHMDSNDDGNVSQAESYEAWLNWFKRIDSNSDNVVTDEEIQAHRQQRKQDRH